MRQPYSPEVKAAALAAVMTGESISSISKRTGIGRATITTWRNEAQLPAPTPDGQQKRIELGEQLFGYLQESITTLGFLVKFTRNERWLTRQSADDVAVLYGVIADKTVRILQGLQSSGTGDEQ